MEAVIDLYRCDLGRLRDPGMWRSFVANLVTVIGVKAYGELRLERSGEGDLCDWSAVQRIVTGSITGHGDEAGLSMLLQRGLRLRVRPRRRCDGSRRLFRRRAHAASAPAGGFSACRGGAAMMPNARPTCAQWTCGQSPGDAP